MLEITDKKILNDLFYFCYAGIIFIQITKCRSKYQVSSCGFEIDVYGKIQLKKDAKVRKSYDDLQTAILQFNVLIKYICEEFEFFKYGYFQSKEWIDSVYKLKSIQG